MSARDGFHYWFSREAAVSYANQCARIEGRRYRVQRVTWDAGSRWRRFYVAPTPADAPTPKVLEPCS